MALHILIAESDVNAALTTAQLLMNNGHQVETCNDGVSALQAIQRRTGQGKPYQILIAAYQLPGMDAIRLFTELRMANIKLDTALCTKPGALTPQLRSEALRLNCKTFFDYPLPLNELSSFVNSVIHQQAHEDGPYFGTSKFGNRGDSEISGGHQTVTPSTNVHTQTGNMNRQTGYNRQSSGNFHMAAGSQSTRRVRRSITGSYTEELNKESEENQAAQQNLEQQADQYFPQTSQFTNPNNTQAPPQQPQAPAQPQQPQAPAQPQQPQAPAQQQPPQLPPIQQQQAYSPQTSNFTNTAGTQRIRRSTTGTFADDGQAAANNPPTQQYTGNSYRVACAHCGQAFAVAEKNEEYNAVCIHCGGLNRILPRNS